MIQMKTLDDASVYLPKARFLGYRWLTVLELAAVVLLILITQWRECIWFPTTISRWLYSVQPGTLGVITVCIVLFSVVRLRDNWHTAGLFPAYWKNGIWSAASFTTVSVVMIVFAGLMVARPQFDAIWLLGFAGDVLLQQVALQCFLNNRLFDLMPNRGDVVRLRFAVITSTGLFVLLHVPNPLLVGGTLVVGGFWTWHFRRNHNLPALMASHLIIGVTAMTFLGRGPLLRLLVGWPAMEALLGRR